MNTPTKTYHFLSGLPRSGSTVLASILNQNPSVYVTPTSPMLNITVKMQEAWREDPTVKANYFETQIRNLTEAILPAFWAHRPEPIIIDKGRGWAKNMPTASALFGHPIKAIVTTRDLPSVMASWLTIIKAQPGCALDQTIIKRGYAPTDDNRMAEMWFNMVRDCMEGLAQIRREAPSQILEVTYDGLVTHPRETLTQIQNFLGLPSHEYDFNNIVNDTQDDDLVAWGFEGLHTIRKSLGKVERGTPQEILGSELFERFVELEKQYT